MAQDQYIALPDGQYVHVPGDATPQQLSALREKLGGMRGKTGPSGLETFGREAALGAFQGLGIAETPTPVKDTLKALGSTPDLKDPGTYLEPAYGIAKGLASSGAEMFEGLGADPQHPAKFGPLDLAKIGHGLGSLSTQLLTLKGGEKAGKTPLAESEVVRGAKAVPEIPRDVVQSVTGAKRTVGKAQQAIAEKNAAKVADFEQQARQARLSARSSYEAGEAEKAKKYEAEQQKWEKAANQAKAKARSEYESAEAKKTAETEAIRKTHERAVEQRGQIEKENARIEAAQKTLDQRAQGSTKELTQNLQSTLDNAKKSFDKEYGDFDRNILGKTPENPKGRVKSDLTAFAKAVEKAKADDIQGSKESIAQFNQIMSRAELGKIAEDAEDTGEKTGIPEGQEIPTVDLRGFITELENVAYNRNLLPDVKTAVKNVANAGKELVMDTVKDVGGSSAVNALKDLNSRYSDYLTDWKDPSATNPLPRVRNILLEGVTTRNPQYPVHLDIAKILKGNNAAKALSLLEKYKQFGASPEILGTYQKTLEQLDALPKPKKVPEVKTPKFPEPITEAKINLPKPPEAPEPTRVADIRLPNPPDIEPFNRQTAMRNTLDDRINLIGKIGQGYKLLNLIADIVRGKIDPAISQGEQMMLIEMARRALTSEKVLDYLSREKRAKAPKVERRTAPQATPRAVERRTVPHKYTEADIDSLIERTKPKGAQNTRAFDDLRKRVEEKREEQ